MKLEPIFLFIIIIMFYIFLLLSLFTPDITSFVNTICCFNFFIFRKISIILSWSFLYFFFVGIVISYRFTVNKIIIASCCFLDSAIFHYTLLNKKFWYNLNYFRIFLLLKLINSVRKSLLKYIKSSWKND